MQANLIFRLYSWPSVSLIQYLAIRFGWLLSWRTVKPHYGNLTFSLLDFAAFVSRADSAPSTKQTTIMAKAIKLITEKPCNLTLKYSRFARGAMLNEVLVNKWASRAEWQLVWTFPFVIKRGKLKIFSPWWTLCGPSVDVDQLNPCISPCGLPSVNTSIRFVPIVTRIWFIVSGIHRLRWKFIFSWRVWQDFSAVISLKFASMAILLLAFAAVQKVLDFFILSLITSASFCAKPKITGYNELPTRDYKPQGKNHGNARN